MITFSDASADIVLGRKTMMVFDRVTAEVPPGRYALLTDRPLVRRSAMDLLAGLKTPHRGYTERQGRFSWPLGRPSMAYPALSGHDFIEMVADLYDLDKTFCGAFVGELLNEPNLLPRRLDRWDPRARYELVNAAALLPKFDVYVIDGTIELNAGRFSKCWQYLFERRIANKPLILASDRIDLIRKYCDRALVAASGGLRSDLSLDDALRKYPPARMKEEGPQADGQPSDEELDEI